MVHLSQRMSACAVVALVASSSLQTVDADTPKAISLELHRLQDSGIHHETYQRRRLKAIDDPFEAVPLNPGMGTHYAWVYAGTPPQRASVITDTGSSLMAFPCSGCAGCGDHTDQPFAARNSSTLEHVTCDNASFFRCEGCANPEKKTCDISQSYMEGSSWRATVVEDIVFLGGEASFQDADMRNTYGTHFKFGCQNHETGLFISQVADGIMGLANNDNHIVAKLFNEQKIANKLFTLCFAPDGGAMSIGAPDTTRHHGEIQYAQVLHTSSHDFYGVELRDVRVADASIEVAPTSYKTGQYIVDSGTTDSYLPSSMKKPFADAFQKATGLDYHTSSSSCQGYTDEDLKKLPNIEFILGAVDGGNLTLTVTPSQYLLQEESGKYCSSIFLSESSGGVIGANIMMGRDVIFDQGNQRVGFVDADCKFRRLPESESSAMTDSTASSTTSSPKPVVTEARGSTSTEPATTVAVETSTPEPTENATSETSSSADAKETATPEPVVTPVPTEATSPPVTEALTSLPPVTEDTPSLIPASPSPAPTTVAPTIAPVSTESAEQLNASPTTPSPTTTVSSGGVHSGTHTSTNASGNTEDDHPVVLTVVGTVLAVAFIVVAVFSVRRHKKASQDPQWSRVKGNEEDGDLDDDDEEELMVHTVGGKKKAVKGKSQQRSDEFDSDEDSNNDDDDDDDSNFRRGGRLADDDDDDSDEDEIFERETDDHGAHKHDARVLERL